MGELLNTKTKPLYKDPLFIIFLIILFVLLCQALFVSKYTLYYITGTSMNNTISDGDYLYVEVNKSPSRGDIVVIEKRDDLLREDETEENIIKRVIATGGDSLYMQKGVVYIKYSGSDNYIVLEESYVAAENNYPNYTYNNVIYDMTAVTVEEGEVFVMGDNRAVSYDSRYYGCVSLSLVVGVVPDWSLSCKSVITAVHSFFASVSNEISSWFD